jgi:hypothetical protein
VRKHGAHTSLPDFSKRSQRGSREGISFRKSSPAVSGLLRVTDTDVPRPDSTSESTSESTSAGSEWEEEDEKLLRPTDLGYLTAEDSWEDEEEEAAMSKKRRKSRYHSQKQKSSAYKRHSIKRSRKREVGCLGLTPISH